MNIKKYGKRAPWVTRHAFLCLSIWFLGIGIAQYAMNNKSTAVIHLITVPACLAMEYMMCSIFKKLDSNKDDKHFKE